MNRTVFAATLAVLFSFSAALTYAGGIGQDAQVLVGITGFADTGDGLEEQSMPDPISIPVNPDTGDFAILLNDEIPGANPAPGNEGAPIWDVTELIVSGNIDPTVTLTGSVTNTSAAPATLVFTTTLPTGPVGPTTLVSGSIGISVTDSSGDGFASLDLAPGSIPIATPTVYEGLIDGATFLPLLGSPPLPLTVSTIGGSATISEDAGIGPSGPTIPGPAVASDLGLSVIFELSPGDSASFTAVFTVEPVPEPTSAGLALLAIAGCFGRRRR